MVDVLAIENRVLKEKCWSLERKFQDAIHRVRVLEEDFDRYKRGYDQYMLIQNACRESPTVANEFSRFLLTCRLAEDESTPGLTVEETQMRFW